MMTECHHLCLYSTVTALLMILTVTLQLLKAVNIPSVEMTTVMTFHMTLGVKEMNRKNGF